jgi:NAD-dependent SIR2 family protein deacetylase
MTTNVDELVTLLRGRRVGVLTGAGISTESGIPDYRGPETRRRARNPIQWREFVSSEAAQRRYWARALVGWSRFANKAPAAGHLALAELERAGVATGVVTQNVDRLHHAAGSARVVELHGTLYEVICLACGDVTSREAFQAELARRNPGWLERTAEVAPDGDAELDDVTGFDVAPCARCGGALKPHVVFFGEGVPKPRVDAAWAIVDEADVLLVVGSSLAVFSGYRFVRGAAKRGQPIAIVNLGETRGDPHATTKLDARAGDVLPRLVDALRG